MAETIDLNTLTPQAVASGDKVLGVGSGGGLKSIPIKDVQLGMEKREYLINESAGGEEVRILLADLGTSLNPHTNMKGFCGFVKKYNTGYLYGTGICVMNALQSYQIGDSGVVLNSTLSWCRPFIARYQGRYYVGIRFMGNSGRITLIGDFYDCLPAPIILGQKNENKPITDAEIVIDGSVCTWGGVNLRFTTTYAGMQKGGRHERNSIAGERAAIGDGDILAFGSLDALCRFLGGLEEDIESAFASSEFLSSGIYTKYRRGFDSRSISDKYFNNRDIPGGEVSMGLLPVGGDKSWRYSSTSDLLYDGSDSSEVLQRRSGRIQSLVSNKDLARKEVAA